MKDFRSMIASVFKHVTIEPNIFFYMFALEMESPAFQLLIYRKSCLHLYSSQVLCQQINNRTLDIEDSVQTEAAQWNMYRSYVETFPAIFMTFIYGALSDHFSRKWTIAFPVMGSILGNICDLINIAYMDLHIGFILLGESMRALSGGWGAYFMAVFSYYGVISTGNNRLVYYSIGDGLISFGLCVAAFLSGIILDHSSFAFIFTFSLGIKCAALLYLIILVKEPTNPLLLSPLYKETNLCGKSPRKRSINLSKVRSSFTNIFKKRKDNKRLQLLVLMACVLLVVIAFGPRRNLSFLYLKRRPMSWTQTLYGYYMGLFYAAEALCLFTFTPFCKKILLIEDATIYLVSIVSSAVGQAIFALCTQTWMVFTFVPWLMLMGAAIFTCKKSIVSQLVGADEIGKVLAALGALQSSSAMLTSTIYSELYPITLPIWPGLCFIIGAAVFILPFGLAWWLRADLAFYKKAYIRMDEEMENISEVKGVLKMENVPAIENISEKETIS